MLSFLTGVAVVFAFAWLSRALLDARSVTWGRLAAAAWLGIAAGYVASVLLVVPSVEAMPDTDWRQVRLVALPFQVIATMGAIVVLELLMGARRPRTRRRLGPMRTLRLGAGIVRRAAQVSRIAARHGMAPLLGLRSGAASSRDPAELARRARTAIEEAGGVFVKLGQLLSTRPDLLPPSAVTELGRLHASVAPVPEAEIRAVLADRLGRPIDEVFARFDSAPLGSASIAQAHAARLHDGREVVVKVRRPGLERIVDRDLAIAGWLARSAQRRTSWAARLGVADLADEFAETLRDELDFRIEARHVTEIAAAARDEPKVHVPHVVDELTRDGVLVLERLVGTTLAELGSERPANARGLADALCGSQLRAMLAGERFHGDPHPGNVLLLDDGGLGLIDLGLSARLDAFERAATFQLLLALKQRQPALLLEALASIGAFDPALHDPDEIERAFARYLAAHLGPGLPPAAAITELLRLVMELGLALPPSTSAMFRALSTLGGTLEHLVPGYPIVDVVAELGGDEAERRMMPASVAGWVQQEWAQLSPILRRAPRHLDRLATQAAHGRLTARVRTLADADDRRFVERMLDRVVLSFLSIGTGAVSVMLLNVRDDPALPLAGVGPYELLGWLGLFVAVTLLFRVLLQVLRTREAGGSAGPSGSAG